MADRVFRLKIKGGVPIITPLGSPAGTMEEGGKEYLLIKAEPEKVTTQPAKHHPSQSERERVEIVRKAKEIVQTAKDTESATPPTQSPHLNQKLVAKLIQESGPGGITTPEIRKKLEAEAERPTHLGVSLMRLQHDQKVVHLADGRWISIEYHPGFSSEPKFLIQEPITKPQRIE